MMFLRLVRALLSLATNCMTREVKEGIPVNHFTNLRRFISIEICTLVENSLSA